MLKITVVAVGKLKEKFWVAACDEYLKRLRPYAKVTVAEIPDVDPARAGGVEAAREREGAVQPGVKEPAAVLFDVQLAVCLDCGDRVPLYFESGGIGVRRGEAEGLSIADGQGDEGRPVAHDKVALSRFDPVRFGLV